MKLATKAFLLTSMLLVSAVHADIDTTKQTTCENCVEENSMYMSKTTTFELDYEPSTAIYLFTAEGEKYWVKNWDPVMPRGDGYNKHDVFIADTFEGKPFYIVLDFDTDKHRVYYSEVIPEVSAGTLEITLKPTDNGGSLVTLTYNLSALSHSGKDYISDFGNNYEDIMQTWKRDIVANKNIIDEWLESK